MDFTSVKYPVNRQDYSRSFLVVSTLGHKEGQRKVCISASSVTKQYSIVYINKIDFKMW